MATTDLSGHSGCKIILVENDGQRPFVRKYSSRISYNERLKLQCEKQASFKCDKIKTPYIIDSGYTDDGLFYFDMEYVKGITLAEYMSQMEVNCVRNIVEDIVNNIIDFDAKSNKNVEKIFLNKITSLESSVDNLENITVDTAINKLKSYNWSRFGMSFCHGDLTLENIIVKNNDLYLIDFLDSFYSSWILDIGKLLQDVQTMWSYRNNRKVSTNTIIRLIVFRDILLEEVCRNNSDLYIDVYYALLLHLIRIYPYTSDPHTFAYLDKKINSVINIINTYEENLK